MPRLQPYGRCRPQGDFSGAGLQGHLVTTAVRKAGAVPYFRAGGGQNRNFKGNRALGPARKLIIGSLSAYPLKYASRAAIVLHPGIDAVSDGIGDQGRACRNGVAQLKVFGPAVSGVFNLDSVEEFFAG